MSNDVPLPNIPGETAKSYRQRLTGHKKLSPTMTELVEYMRKHGGKIYRHPGGFWGNEHWQMKDREWFGTSSVEAIVTRGYATYTEWKDGRRGGPRFPVMATLANS